MSKVADRAWAMVDGTWPMTAEERALKAGNCEAFAWRVARDALGFDPNAKYGIAHLYAEQAEYSAISRGLAVKDLMPGDLVYQHWYGDIHNGDGPRNWGHVGVYIGERNGVKYVLENTLAQRGRGIPGAGSGVRLTTLNQWVKEGGLRTIIRFPADVKTAQDKTQQAPDVATTAASAGATGAAGGGGETGAAASEDTTPLGLMGISKSASGTTIGVPTADAKFDDHDPAWIFNTLKGYEDRVPSAAMTTMGKVQSIVVLRSPYDTEMDTAMPFIGPMIISLEAMKDRLKEDWANLNHRYGNSESWGRYYKPQMKIALNQDRNTAYRFPVPDVVSINYRQEAHGVASADVELEVPHDEDAEALTATLCTAASQKSLMAEIWLPMFYYDPNQEHSVREVLIPQFVGMIEEVTSNPYPNNIRFRVVPQDTRINSRGIDPQDGTTNSWPAGTKLCDIILKIADDYKLKVWTPSALSVSQLKQLQAETAGEFNALYQPPLDVIRQIVEQAGLQMSRQYGLDILGRIIGAGRGGWMIYDPLAFSPLDAGFWKNELWTNAISKIFTTITGNPVQGEVTVFYPQNLNSDPQYIQRMSTVLALYATRTGRQTSWRKFIDGVSSILNVVGVGDGPAVYAARQEGVFKTHLSTLIDDWYKSESGDSAALHKWMVPAVRVEEFSQRLPTEQEMGNPVFGSLGGVGAQAQPVDAERAAKMMQMAAAPDGSFFLQTPNGKTQLQGSDKVYLYYSSNMSRPSMVVPVNQDPQRSSGENKFYPYTVTLKVLPQYGVRVGGLATLVGFGRLDGNWEIQSVQHSLSSSDQELIVTLRTQRSIYAD